MDDLPRYLIAIAEEGSINKAAKRVHLTQPALSQRLKSFEASLGTPLFERTKTTMVPTHAGQVYLEWARSSVVAEDRMLRDVADIARRRKRRMALGVSLPRSRTILPPVLERFYGQVEGCTVTFAEAGKTEKIDRLLADDAIDIAVLTPVPPSQSLFCAEPLCSERLVLACPKGTEVACDRSTGPFPTVEVQEAGRLPFIMPPRHHHLYWVVKTMMDTAGVHLDVVMTSSETPFTLSMVRHGAGSTVIPSTFIEPDETGIDCYLIEGYSKCNPLWLSHRVDWEPGEDVRVFLGILADYVAASPLLRLE